MRLFVPHPPECALVALMLIELAFDDVKILLLGKCAALNRSTVILHTDEGPPSTQMKDRRDTHARTAS